MSQWTTSHVDEWVAIESEWSNGGDEYYVILSTQQFIINPKMYAFEANSCNYAFVASDNLYNITANNKDTAFIASTKKYYFINED